MFVAGRHIKIERNGAAVDIGPGEAVPEAAEWPHDVLIRCMKVGQIVNVAESEKVDAVTAPMAAKTHALGQAKTNKKTGKSRAA